MEGRVTLSTATATVSWAADPEALLPTQHLCSLQRAQLCGITDTPTYPKAFHGYTGTQDEMCPPSSPQGKQPPSIPSPGNPGISNPTPCSPAPHPVSTSESLPCCSPFPECSSSLSACQASLGPWGSTLKPHAPREILPDPLPLCYTAHGIQSLHPCLLSHFEGFESAGKDEHAYSDHRDSPFAHVVPLLPAWFLPPQPLQQARREGHMQETPCQGGTVLKDSVHIRIPAFAPLASITAGSLVWVCSGTQHPSGPCTTSPCWVSFSFHLDRYATF